MNAFWSNWVMILALFNLGVALFLFLWGPRVKVPTLPDGTSGHVWAHGVLREGVRRLPLWWLLISACVFASGVIYLVLYPGVGNYKGLLGWTSQQELQQNTAANQVNLDRVLQPQSSPSVEQLSMNPQARRIAQRLYEDNCAACHGQNAYGNRVLGAPNLTDDDWL